MAFIIPGQGELDNIYCTDEWLYEQFGGDRLWAWGRNNTGALGDNTTADKSSPVQTITGGTNWKQVVCSRGAWTIAIKTDGTLWGWGQNSQYPLGTTTTDWRSSPVQTLAGGTNWKQVSGGTNHSCAIKTDGTLWTWGDNFYGQLGDNISSGSAKSSPTQTIASGTNWKQVSAGSQHTTAIKTDGTLWTWGRNNFGQLGTNDIITRSSPIQTIAGGTNWKQVSAFSTGFAAIKTDGTLWMCGYNQSGQLGTNDNINRSSPIQTVAGGTNWKQISGGTSNIAAIKTDGTLWTWGYIYGNQTSSPVQTTAGGTNWKQVSCGNGLNAAIKTDGSLWVWGSDNYGQLAQGTWNPSSSPIQTIAGGTNWKQVSCGYAHMAAITINNLNTTGVE